MAEKTVNYTAEQTAALVEAFVAGSTIEQLAESTGRSTRSVIAKLSREGVYTAKSRAKGEGRALTKAELITGLELKTNLPAGTLASLEKASREALALLVAAVV